MGKKEKRDGCDAGNVEGVVTGTTIVVPGKAMPLTRKLQATRTTASSS